jgi:hypothetical protein
MTRSIFRALPIGLLPLLLLVTAAHAATAQACTLDGIASISMNGITANLTEGTPSPGDSAHWAPFTLLAAAPDDQLQLREDLGKVRQSLSPAMMSTPFRWDFDDGTSAQGFAVTHRFTQLGWHKITVDYYYPTRRQWITFDSAQLRIVPAGALLWTNLPHYIAVVLQTIMRIAIWLLLGIVTLAMIVERLQRGRRGRRTALPADSAVHIDV